MKQRNLQTLYQAHPTKDGAGVKILRTAIHSNLQAFDPFLLLDEIVSDSPDDYIGGFPEHPHRGFETVTYMLEGRMRHRDHMGNERVLEPGAVQWMTAGRGVIHSEMPEQTEGKMHGFQLWLNLPAKEKMQPAAYKEFSASEIPAVKLGPNSTVKIIAGTLSLEQESISGPIQGKSTQPDFYDVHVAAGETVRLPIKEANTALIYTFEGKLQLKETARTAQLLPHSMAKLSQGDHVILHAEDIGGRALILSGKPIKEPIVNWGPFVMNTSEEIEQAIYDYNQGNLV